MQIDPNTLKEENYTNPRLIEIQNEEIAKLYAVVLEHQKTANPFIERFQEIETKKAELKAPLEAYMKEVKQEQEDLMGKMEAEDQLASKVKEKLVPLLEDEILPQLGEFDEFVGIENIDGKMYAKINDKVEELVKAMRDKKATK
jgi:predicted transcriptional regulator